MNKILKLLAAVTLIALTAAACQKEKLFDSQTAGEETVTFTVQTDAAATKALADGDGSGSDLDRCLVAVYMKTGNSAEPYKLYDTPATTGSGLNYTFTVNLIRKQTYQIVVWADKGETVYDVNEGLTLVTRKTGDVACNSDAYDAFYASTEFVQGTTTSTAITAKRPFAQLNLITKDLNENFQPSAVSVTYSSPQSFNPFDGSVSDITEVTYKADSPYYTSTARDQHTLVMNYLFAAAEDQTILPSVKMTAKLTVDAEIEVANVPVKRNYRTNIIGNLLTEQTDFNITVDSDWGDSDIDVEWVSVATVTDANLALQAGKTNVAVESVESNSVILLPETPNTIGISLPSGNTNAVTIKYLTSNESGQTPNLNVAAENNTGDLVINAPQSHVTLNGAAYTNVTASTSNTTLVVEEGVTIANLTVNQGAVEIYGTVNSIALAEGCTIKVWAVGDEETWTLAYGKGAQTISLKNSFEISNPLQIGRSLDIQGNGYEISHGTGSAQNSRVVNINGLNNQEYNFYNTIFSEKSTGAYSRGINVWGEASGSKITLDGCTVSAGYYALNFIIGPSDIEFTIKNGTVAAGWAAINCYANNSTFTVENSTLKGVNDKSEGSWNDFSTIVFDGNGLWDAANLGVNGTGNSLNVVNSTIYASSESSNNQSWLALQYGAQRNIVKVDAATRIIDAAGNDQTYNVCLYPIVGYVSETEYTTYDLESEIWLAGQNAFPGFYQQDGVYHINSTNGLNYFSQKVNGGESFSGKTVVLDADIDLNNVEWTPVGQTGATQFQGTFDGQRHTISNLKINNTDEGGNCATGLFGWLNSATVKNIKISGATITGHHNVGTIAGYLETSGCTIENCTVENATISCTSVNDDANGDKCGGIVGHAGNAGVIVKDCGVKNSQISAGRDAGQVVGAAKAANVVNCSATNVTVTANGSSTGANIRNELIGRVL